MDFKTRWQNFWVDFKLADWIVAFFTAILAVVAIFQFLEMRKNSKDTHTLAEQAKVQSQAALTQATLSQQSFDAVFHPIVEVSSITYNQSIRYQTPDPNPVDDGIISYTLKNVGSAPAEKLRIHVKAIFGATARDVSPRNVPSEFGVGATFTDAPKVTYGGNETSKALFGSPQLKVRFYIQFAAHDHPPVWQCSSFMLEPSKREMYQVADTGAHCGE
jgi:hypothetical protein